MTGHGRGEARGKAWSAVVECFSVNRKSAEVVFHTDRSAAWLEPSVRERVLGAISRGRVQVNLLLTHTAGDPAGILDKKRAGIFVCEARALAKALKIPGEITISDVLGAPGVVRSAEPAGEGVKAVVLLALDRALAGLVATRSREGLALRRVLEKSLAKLSGVLRKILPLARRAALQNRESLLRRVGRSGIAIPADDPRLLTEVALLAERGDITEELHRAESHIDQFREKLASGGPVGRTLEFLAQELSREFNTVGSKSSDTSLARLVIEAKAELDRIREQLANLE